MKVWQQTASAVEVVCKESWLGKDAGLRQTLALARILLLGEAEAPHRSDDGEHEEISGHLQVFFARESKGRTMHFNRVKLKPK